MSQGKSAAHTPGPLKVETWNGGHSLQIVSSEDLCTAEYTAPEGAELDAHDYANFALYAAAPTMLEALKYAKRSITEELAAFGNDTDHPMYKRHLKAAELAEAAIKLARGESQ